MLSDDELRKIMFSSEIKSEGKDSEGSWREQDFILH